MSSNPAPKVSRGPTLPLVWIVPLVALIVGGWMVWREFRNRGPELTIEFADGSGLEARKTVLEHKGVAVGTVTAVTLKPDLSGVVASVRLDKHATALAREGAQFWIVRPEIGFSGLKGIDTLLTGARLNVRPGTGALATRFHGLEHAPPLENAAEGRAFLLEAAKLGSISPGAPVFYREVRVGTVETSRLANDAGAVLIRIRVETPYVDLVRNNSRFWNAGGASFRISLLGAQLKSTSLESLFTGGVAFATPDGGELAPVAPEGTVFPLHDEADKDWLKWSPKIPIHPPDTAPERSAPSGPLAPLVKH
jgi:paraquat-inducible protein B